MGISTQYPFDEVAFYQYIGTSFYPVGATYITIVNADPSVILGFGIWIKIAEGQALFGHKAGDPNFGIVEGIGGALNHYHDLIDNQETNDGGGHVHEVNPPSVQTSVKAADASMVADGGPGITFQHDHSVDIPAFNSEAIAAHKHVFNGASKSASGLNPYYTVYIWKRTA